MGLTRSEQMARIRGADTKPELRLRRALWNVGLRYRVNQRVEGTRPDLVFLRARVAVFVDGCFWHGCPEHYVRPRTREEFWSDKLAGNVMRDSRQTLSLEAKGWVVFRFLEHEVMESLGELVELVSHSVSGFKGLGRNEERVWKVEVLDANRDIERRHLCLLRAPRRVRQVDGPRKTTKWKNRR